MSEELNVVRSLVVERQGSGTWAVWDSSTNEWTTIGKEAEAVGHARDLAKQTDGVVHVRVIGKERRQKYERFYNKPKTSSAKGKKDDAPAGNAPPPLPGDPVPVPPTVEPIDPPVPAGASEPVAPPQAGDAGAATPFTGSAPAAPPVAAPFDVPPPIPTGEAPVDVEPPTPSSEQPEAPCDPVEPEDVGDPIGAQAAAAEIYNTPAAPPAINDESPAMLPQQDASSLEEFVRASLTALPLVAGGYVGVRLADVVCVIPENDNSRLVLSNDRDVAVAVEFWTALSYVNAAQA